ncbi:hypothetical protein GCM10023093_17310 [Nemorincola caseinilytica]|uniref:DUF3164 family protein n=1 Tax=Nemorincola caseinilytica TaxID=2054315 RepID=A0ABP8NG95_9BACT
MATTTKAIADMTVEELQQALKEKQATDTAERQAQRKRYEQRKEALINTLGGFATGLRAQMTELKQEAFGDMAKFRLEMMEYGDIRGGEKNKGSFELKNEQYKIVFKNSTVKAFDERAELAEKKLKEFLGTFVKRKDKPAYELVMALLERNDKTGDFDINLINRLYKMRDKFDDPLWHEAIDLFQESYSPYGSAQYIQFFERNKSTNGYDAIVLDMARLRLQDEIPKAKEQRPKAAK